MQKRDERVGTAKFGQVDDAVVETDEGEKRYCGGREEEEGLDKGVARLESWIKDLVPYAICLTQIRLLSFRRGGGKEADDKGVLGRCVVEEDQEETSE